MPRPPPDFETKVNFIVDFILDPCDAPLTIWVEAFKPAVLKLLWAWYMPDLSNILTAWLRPYKMTRELRTRRKTRQGWKWGRAFKSFWLWKLIMWAPDEMVGKFLSTWFDMGDRKVHYGAVTMWAIYGVLERVFFWWFVAEIVSDFWFEWLSTVQQSMYCQAQNMDIILATSPRNLIVPLFGWTPLLTPDIQKIRGTVTPLAGGAAFASNTPIAIVAGATVTSVNGGPFEWGIRIRKTSGLDQGIIAQATGSTPAGQSAAVSMTATIMGPGSYIVEVFCNLNACNFDAIDNYASTYNWGS